LVWPRLPAMPETDDDACRRRSPRVAARRRAAVVDALLGGEVDPRTCSQRRRSMLTSVLSRVMPALWTTTSTRPWRSRTWSGGAPAASSAVMSSCSDSPHLVGDLGEGRALRGDVEAHDVAPSRASTSGDGGPDATRRAGDDRDLAASGRAGSSVRGRSRMATTPLPPAAQIEISARPPPRSSSSFAAVATMRRRSRRTGGRRPATSRRVQPGRGRSPERLVAARAARGRTRRPPRPSGCRGRWTANASWIS
jgi:hypothetical protein